MRAISTFGQWLKLHRQSLDLTQEALAEATGYSIETIRKLENGHRRPSRNIAELLAETLRVPLSERGAFVQWARGAGEGPESVHSMPDKASAGSSSQSLNSSAQSVPPPPVPASYVEGVQDRFADKRLPVPPTPLIGREKVLAQGRALFWRTGNRLVTLTGPPGTGKTRLSLALAASLQDDFRDGVVFVPLAPLSDPALLVVTITRILGVVETSARSLLQALIDYLRDKQMLMLLDNFEQLLGLKSELRVVEAAATVAEIMQATPQVKILVTSRAALHIRGEKVLAVPPLDTPNMRHPQSISELARVESVALFVERAQDVQSDFALTEANARAVAAVCARLEGLPLAIELAAARIKLFSPQDMLDRLRQRQELLTGGARDLPARHQTLRNAIAWSYDLLSDGEQALFTRLGVFVGGCTLSAVEAVCNPRGDLPAGVLAGIESLLDKSLLRQEWTQTDEPRFMMLETILEYARERLQADASDKHVSSSMANAHVADSAEIRQLHAEYYLAMAETTNPQLVSTEQKLWVDRLELEHNNLRAVLQWSMESSEGVEIGLRMLAALVLFWEMHSHFTEGRAWVAEYLSRTEPARPTTHRALALLGAARLAVSQDDYGAARSHFEEALAIGRELADERLIAYALGYLAWVNRQNNYAEARVLLMDSISFFEQCGDRWGLIEMRTLLAWLATGQNDYETARSLLEGTVVQAFEAGDKWHSQLPLYLLGNTLMAQGEYEQASPIFRQTLAIAQELGDRLAAQAALNCLGRVALNRGDSSQAKALFQQGLALAREMGVAANANMSLLYLGQVALAQGDDIRAEEFLSQSADWAREQESRPVLAHALNILAQVAMHRQEYKKAKSLLAQGLYVSQGVGRIRSLALQLLGLAAVAGATGQPAQAGRLGGAAEAALDTIHADLEPKDRTYFDRHISMARTGLAESVWDAAWQEGRAMTLEQVLADALQFSTAEED